MNRILHSDTTQFAKLTRYLMPIIWGIVLIGYGSQKVSVAGDYVYQVPDQINDGWEVSPLANEGIDEQLITKLTNQIRDGKYQGIHSLVIVKNGKLVHEAYFDGYERESLHKVYSITKSITSALVGIAIDKGHITDIDVPVRTFFPNITKAFNTELKRRITIKDVLTLTSGFEWDEKTYSCCDPRNSECQMLKSSNWHEYVLGRPMAASPGETWVYNTGSVHLFSGIFENATGISVDEFAENHLFSPLGITQYEWAVDPNGFHSTGGIYGGLSLKSRDLAKFGCLYLYAGQWQGRQVVPGKWVEESIAHQVTAPGGREFGYLWWRGSFVVREKKLDHYFAAGYGGQSCHIVPDLDLIIVFTCWSQPQDADIFAPLLTIYNAALKTNDEI